MSSPSLLAMMENPRVLASTRVSVLTDDSLSGERQIGIIEHWTNGPAVQGTIVGVADDLDVSGGLHPFKRPKLGPWFTQRYDEWDVIAVPKLDRLSRRAAHFAEVFDWCRQHGKVIVSVTEGIDMSTPMGKMFAQIIAAFAEGELDTIRARALGGAQTRLEKGVWVGGVLPFGYLFVPAENGGKRLRQEPTYAALAQDIVAKIGDDWSSHRIALDLNKRKVLTWRDHLRVSRDKEPKGIDWTSNTIMAILKNPTMGGVYTYKGELVEDEEGNPIPITDDPIMPYSEWADLVAGIVANKRSRRAIPSRTMLGGVAICGTCSSRMSSHKNEQRGKVYHYYACNATNTGRCAAPTRVRLEDLEAAVTKFIDETIGDSFVMERVQTQVSKFRTDLDLAQTRLNRLEADYLAGKYDDEGQDESYQRMHKAVTGRIAKLRSEVEKAGVLPAFASTGRTYRETWQDMDGDQRRIFLQRHSIEITVNSLGGIREVKVRMPDLKALATSEGLQLPSNFEWAEGAEWTSPLPGRRKRGEGNPIVLAG
jgi:DNA invertase Pin-like site-specific DNA recombinase